MNEGALRAVRLLGVPLDVHRRASEHGATLRRELAFVELATDPAAAPVRLHLLGRSLADRYGALTAAQDARLAEALEAGEDAVDLEYELPVQVADACDELEALFEELDEFCREGDLLTLVTPAEALAYRRWFLDEVREQLREGRAPRPWGAAEADPADEPQASGAPPPSPAAGSAAVAPEDRIVVTDDLDLALAPTLREQIVRRTDAGAAQVVVDLAGCGFMDSTGLSLLLTTHLRLAATGGGLRVAGASGQVLSVLEMSGVSELLIDAAG
jgi:anti-sigma B factor antagonist